MVNKSIDFKAFLKIFLHVIKKRKRTVFFRRKAPSFRLFKSILNTGIGFFRRNIRYYKSL